MSCALGKLYNKDSIIEYLLDKSAYGDGQKICGHIRSLKVRILHFSNLVCLLKFGNQGCENFDSYAESCTSVHRLTGRLIGTSSVCLPSYVKRDERCAAIHLHLHLRLRFLPSWIENGHIFCFSQREG